MQLKEVCVGVIDVGWWMSQSLIPSLHKEGASPAFSSSNSVEHQLNITDESLGFIAVYRKAVLTSTIQSLGKLEVLTQDEGRKVAYLLNDRVRQNGLWFRGPKGTIGNISFETGSASRTKIGDFFIRRSDGASESLSDGFSLVTLEERPTRRMRSGNSDGESEKG